MSRRRQPTGRERSAWPAASRPIDLASALQLAGVENPEILIARQRVLEAVAVRQLAAAQILPSLNLGMNYDAHTGPLQQSSGNILKVNRSALYVGAGANAVAAGTVNIPGLVYNLNVSEGDLHGPDTPAGRRAGAVRQPGRPATTPSAASPLPTPSCCGPRGGAASLPDARRGRRGGAA